MSLRRWLAALLFFGFLGIYIRTMAPSVLAGDSAELQLAAPLLGVPHPTTYPLFVLLGKLATLAVPLGDLAWRVTLVSALCAALAVALFFLLALRAGLSLPAAGLAALALGVTPGLWNAATLAEVYALLALLMAALALALVSGRAGDWRLCLAALIGGLGFTHHGLFVITALPVLAGCVIWRLRGAHHLRVAPAIGLCFLFGCLPWLFPLAQYARYGPFDGQDYGLPRHYYWGAPESWGQVLDLLTGGAVRRGIFRLPSPGDALATLRMVGERMLFEFGPLGVALGLAGCAALARRSRGLWLGAAWVFFATLGYLLLLGPAVTDAPIFTLPMLLPWALWLGFGVEAALRAADWLWARAARRDPNDGRRTTDTEGLSSSIVHRLSSIVYRPSAVVFALLFAATLWWADTRVEHSSKRQLWLYRRFGEATLAGLPPGAAVIAHWEQGMTLQYLRLVEGMRPDVWVDVVEPGDEAWGPRARRRYAGRPVFFIGQAPDVEGLPVELVREDEYALLFRLRE